MEHDSNSNEKKNSVIRNEAIEKVIHAIEMRSKRFFSKEAENRIRRVLSNYEIEDGVSVFMASFKPEGKEKIAKIDIGKENMILWWGENIKSNRSSHSNQYSLGVSFVNKEYDEIVYYTRNEIIYDYPKFREYFSSLEKGTCFKLYVYAKAKALYKDVNELHGTWLLQVPQNGKLVPSEAIGKVVGKEVYIFMPNNNIRTRRYARKIKII